MSRYQERAIGMPHLRWNFSSCNQNGLKASLESQKLKSSLWVIGWWQKNMKLSFFGTYSR